MPSSWMRALGVSIPLVALAGCNFGKSSVAPEDGGSNETSTGGQGQPKLTASPTTESFGTVAVGQQSASAAVTITNAGDAETTPLVLDISGADEAAFGIDSGCSGQALAPAATCTVHLHFSPSQAASAQATLTVSSDGGASATVALTGTGATPGALALSPSTQDFGTGVVGNAAGAPTSFTLKNTGGVGLDGVSVSLTGGDSGDFSIASDACSGKSLAAGATCAVGVAFGPKTVGSKAATLAATATGGAMTATASLSGTAVTGASFAATPSTFDFGSVEQGTKTPPSQTFTVKNTGGAASGTPAVFVNGTNAADFVVSGNACSGPVGADASCTFGVTFTPSSAAAETATVTITAASTTSATVTVQGTGLAPASLTLDPTTQALGSVVQGSAGADSPFVVTNGGGVTSGPLAVTLTGSNADQFALGADGCTGQQLKAGATCTVNAHAAPTATGPVGGLQASLEVTGTPGGAAAATLTGTAIAQAQITVSPTSQAMGTVAQGASSGAVPFVVTNDGGAPTGLLQVTLTGADAGQYSVGTDACVNTSLDPGKSCTIDVYFTPGAGALGAEQATLSITGSPGGTATSSLTGTAATPASLRISPTSEPFAATPQGAVTPDVKFTVSNGGGVSSGTLKTALGGANLGQFALGTDGCTGQALGPMQTCTVTAHFAPSLGTLGTQQGTLGVTGSPGGTATANLTGTATSPLTISPASPTLASGAFEAPGATTTLTVTSASLGSVGPLSVTVPAQFALDLSKTTCSNANLTAAAPTCTVGVYLNPSAASVVGGVTGTLQVSAGTGTSATDLLSATALTPATLVVTTSSGGVAPFGFGTVRQNTPKTDSFVLTNEGAVTSGTVALSITGTAPGSNDYKVVNDTCPAQLLPNTPCTFDVTFTPSTTTTESATLVAATTAGVGSSSALSGSGAQPVLQYFYAGQVVTSYDYGGVLVSVAGAVVPPGTATFTLANNGQVATDKMLTSGSLAAGYTLTADTCYGQPLNPGGKCSLTVTFQNATPCAEASTVLTMTDDFVSASLDLSATGVASGADYQLTYSPHASTPPDMTIQLGGTGAFTYTLTNCGNATGAAVIGFVNDAPVWFSKSFTNNTCTSNPGLAELASCSFQQDVNGVSATTGPEEGYAGVELTGQVVLSVRPTLTVQ